MISVCIATYNGASFIHEQILSILPQLSQYDQIVISDDGSNDNTIKIIKDIEDSRIKIIRNKRERGYTSNFENALNNADGDIIFLSDQDDIWYSNKVEICMNYLQKFDFVVTDATIINKSGELIHNSFYTLRNPFHSLIGNLFKFGYLGCCMAFKKDILKKALPFPKNHKLCTHDNWLFLIAKTYYKTIIINQKLIKYRRHNNNVSSGGIKKTTNLLFKFLYRSYLIYHLLLVFIKPIISNENISNNNNLQQ